MKQQLQKQFTASCMKWITHLNAKGINSIVHQVHATHRTF